MSILTEYTKDRAFVKMDDKQLERYSQYYELAIKNDFLNDEQRAIVAKKIRFIKDILEVRNSE
uniref:Uncharacterized protein n=1 Tax=viral metagenome TaxID=1070528 RepID=A0A6H2A3M0_9ZZZZ